MFIHGCSFDLNSESNRTLYAALTYEATPPYPIVTYTQDEHRENAQRKNLALIKIASGDWR